MRTAFAAAMISRVQTGVLLVCLLPCMLMLDLSLIAEAHAGSIPDASVSTDSPPAVLEKKSPEDVAPLSASEPVSESTGSGENIGAQNPDNEIKDGGQPPAEDQAPRDEAGYQKQEKEPDAGQNGPGTQAGKKKEEQKTETIMDILHAGISQGIKGTATWMDSFFGDRRYLTELNQSYIRFRYYVFLEDDSKLLRKSDFEFRLVLPQLKEKTHLVFTGSPSDQDRKLTAFEAGTEREQTTTTQERNVSAAVHQTLRETARDSIILRAGLRLHKGRPEIMLGPRYRILFPLDSWHLRFVEEALWRSRTGWEAKSTIDMERSLPNGLFFRATNEWLWKEDDDGFVYAFIFHLGQPVNYRRGFEYQWVNIFHTQPVNELTEIAVRVRYRQQFWRDWLFFDVTPQYRFPRDRSFEATPGILFGIDIIFGNY